MTLQEIDALLLTDLISPQQSYQNMIVGRIKNELLNQLHASLPEDVLPSEEQLKEIEDKEIPQEDLDAEFDIYKAGLRVIEIERLRIQDLKDRVANLGDYVEAHAALYPDVPNKKIHTKKLILINPDKDDAETHMKALEASHAQIKAKLDAVAYKKSRKAEYPSLEDQLDKIYHDGIDSWKVDIKAIKDKYPKP